VYDFENLGDAHAESFGLVIKRKKPITALEQVSSIYSAYTVSCGRNRRSGYRKYGHA
jgi:hypothetical protein